MKTSTAVGFAERAQFAVMRSFRRLTGNHFKNFVGFVRAVVYFDN